MSENESAPAEITPEAGSTEPVATELVSSEPVVAEKAAAADAVTTEAAAAEAVPPEEITYHAVEKDGQVTAIWEMQGRKHMRTIDPRSRQGQDILRLYTSDHHDETPAKDSSEAASV